MKQHLSLLVAALLASALNVLAQSYSNLSAVVDSAGLRASGGTQTNISAVGQSGGIGVSKGGNLVNYAGFLNTFSLKRGLDTDSDGLEDELDTDNDSDLLDDLAEITGSPFGGIVTTDPNNQDTDGDGMDDYSEAFTGTNPRDPQAYLYITDISYQSDTGEIIIQWLARQSKTYGVYGIDSLYLGFNGTLEGTVPVLDGGVPPWYETSGVFTNTPGSPTNRFYYIKVE